MDAAALPSLIGRAKEMRALDAWLDRIAAGKGGAALLEGEAGIGKSRLVEAVCSSAASRSFAVSLAAADLLDRGRPFGALGDALGASLEPPANLAAVPGLEFRLVDQVVELVEAIALDGPALLVVEDLHWADQATLASLGALLRRLAHLPLALLATFRPWPRSADLDRLVDAWRDGNALHLVIEPLDQASVAELASAIVDARLGATFAQQLASAGGNPLFVGELVGALVAEGAVELAEGGAELEAHALPPSLRVTILRRLSLLGDRTLSRLRMASMLGATFSLADLAAVCRNPASELLEDLLEARAAGVVEEAGSKLRFRHALIRDALYTDMPQSARQALHIEAARSLASAGASRVLIAEQFSLGALVGDREAVSWLREAARESMRRAPQSAVALLERAAELAEVGDPGRDELLAELADGLVWCRQPSDGEALAAQLLARTTDPTVRDQARATVVRGLWLDGRWRELLAHVDRWLAAGALTDEARARLLADGAFAALFCGELSRAESMALEALQTGEALSDNKIVFQALWALGPLYNFRGRTNEELAAAERALAIAAHGENPDLARFHPHFPVALALEANDRHDDAEKMFSTGMRVREELGTVWELPMYQAGLAELHYQMGKWDEALVEADTGITIAEEVDTRVGVALCAAVAALIHVHRDDLTAAGRRLSLARDVIDRAGPQWGSYWAILASAALDDARGDRETALTELRDAWSAHDHSPGLQVYLGTPLVRLALAAGETRLAHAVATTVRSNAQTISAPSGKGSALQCAALVNGDSESLKQAVAEFRASGWLHHLATACEDTATALARDGDPTTARPVFEEAVTIYERLEARRDSARTLATMRSLGMRRGSRATHRRALKGWDSLTPTESDVVRLMIEGLTNREIGERLFISRRTVQTHLSHVFTKLEVSTRVELATVAARHQ